MGAPRPPGDNIGEAICLITAKLDIDWVVSFSVYVEIFILSKGSPQKVDVSAINGSHYIWETSYLKEADLRFSHFQQRLGELDHLLLNDIFGGKNIVLSVTHPQW